MKNDSSGFMGKNKPTTTFIPKVDKKLQEQVTSKCECKVVKKLALETEN